MTKSKFTRKIRRTRLPKWLIIPIKSNKSKSQDIQFGNEFQLSETEKIRYIYTKNEKNRVSNIICVSYDVYIQNEWVTIVYSDSEHGPLHRHETISFENRSDLVVDDQVKKKGTPEDWLTWTINDIKARRNYYKKQFLKRSNVHN